MKLSLSLLMFTITVGPSSSMLSAQQEAIIAYSEEIVLGSSYYWKIESIFVDDLENMSVIDESFSSGSIIEMRVTKELPQILSDEWFFDFSCCYSEDYLLVQIDGRNSTAFQGSLLNSAYLTYRGNFQDEEFSIILTLLYPIRIITTQNEILTLADQYQDFDVKYYDDGDKLIYTSISNGFYLNQTLDLSSGLVIRQKISRAVSFCCLTEGNATFSLEMEIMLIDENKINETMTYFTTETQNSDIISGSTSSFSVGTPFPSFSSMIIIIITITRLRLYFHVSANDRRIKD